MESQLISNRVMGSQFTPVQKEYLQGFFRGLAQRGIVPFCRTNNRRPEDE